MDLHEQEMEVKGFTYSIQSRSVDPESHGSQSISLSSTHVKVTEHAIFFKTYCLFSQRLLQSEEV